MYVNTIVQGLHLIENACLYACPGLPGSQSKLFLTAVCGVHQLEALKDKHTSKRQSSWRNSGTSRVCELSAGQLLGKRGLKSPG